MALLLLLLLLVLLLLLLAASVVFAALLLCCCFVAAAASGAFGANLPAVDFRYCYCCQLCCLCCCVAVVWYYLCCCLSNLLLFVRHVNLWFSLLLFCFGLHCFALSVVCLVFAAAFRSLTVEKPTFAVSDLPKCHAISQLLRPR